MNQDNEPPRVIFEEEEFQHSTRTFGSENSKIIRWVMRCSGGIIKNEKQANYVLLGFVILAIIISFFLIFGDGKTAGSPKDIKILPAEF